MRICVSLGGSIKDYQSGLVQAVKQKADLAELRLDFLQDTLTPFNFQEFAAKSSLPLMTTIRSSEEGGQWRGAEESKLDLLLKTAESGAAFVDVSYHSIHRKAKIAEAIKSKAKLVVSSHFVGKTPTLPELRDIVRQSHEAGADIVKVVGLANTFVDNFRILELLSIYPQIPLIAFCMGELGKMSRIMSPMMGAYLTFACLNQTKATAPGQITVKELRSAWDVLSVAP